MTEHPVKSILNLVTNLQTAIYSSLTARVLALSKDIHSDVQEDKRLFLFGDSILREAVLGPWYSSNESTNKSTC